MDTLFVIDKNYIENNIDGKMIYDLLKKYASWSCDAYIVTPATFYNASRKWEKVPVGDLDFVRGYTDIKPIEIPECLRAFVNRKYDITEGCNISEETLSKYFVKDADTLKSWNNSLGYTLADIHDDSHYVVSEKVDFVSEYRCFVHNDNILACQNYLGDPLTFPDPGYIKDVVCEYSEYDHPKAYTLDIGVHDGVTDIIEIHPFVSCGLYGFYDKEMVEMLKDGYSWCKQTK